MSSERREISTSSSTLKPSATIYLTETEGSYIHGILKQRVASKLFPDKNSYLIVVEDTNAPTRIWDKATKTEVPVVVIAGDTVFLRDSTNLRAALDQVKDGERIEVVYTGKGKAKPGRRAPYLFKVIAG